MRDVFCQIRRGCRAKNLLCVTLLIFYALLFPYFDTPLFRNHPIRFFQFENFYYHFTVSFQFGLLRYVIPIAATVPMGFSFVEDDRTRYIDLAACRMSNARFVVRRMIASVCATMIAIGLALVLYTLFLLALSPLNGGHGTGEGWLESQQNTPLSWLATKEHYGFYVLWQIGILLIASSIWSLVALAFSFLWTNKPFVFLATFGTSLLLDNILEGSAGAEWAIHFLQSPDFIIMSTPVPVLMLREVGYLALALLLYAVCAAPRFSQRLRHFLQSSIMQPIPNMMVGRKRRPFDLPGALKNSFLARLLLDVHRNCTKATILPAVAMPIFILLAKPDVLLVRHSVGDLLMRVFGGIPWWDPTVSFEQIGYWLMVLLPSMMGVAINLERELSRTMLLSIHRYPSDTQWWLSKYLACDIYVMINAMVMFLSVIVFGLCTGSVGMGIVMEDADGFPVRNTLVLLKLFHIFTWQALLLSQVQWFFHAVSNQMHIGLIANLLPLLMVMVSFSYFDRDYFVYIPYHWGMIQRSELFSPSFMPDDLGGQIPLNAINMNLCMGGQMLLVAMLGALNVTLSRVIKFTERGQAA